MPRLRVFFTTEELFGYGSIRLMLLRFAEDHFDGSAQVDGWRVDEFDLDAVEARFRLLVSVALPPGFDLVGERIIGPAGRWITKTQVRDALDQIDMGDVYAPHRVRKLVTRQESAWRTQ